MNLTFLFPNGLLLAPSKQAPKPAPKQDSRTDMPEDTRLPEMAAAASEEPSGEHSNRPALTDIPRDGLKIKKYQKNFFLSN